MQVMSENKEVPQLRFREFKGGWEKSKLRYEVEFRNGKGHEQNIDNDGKYVVVNSKFVSTEGKVRKYTNKLMSPLRRQDIVMVMSDIPNGKALSKCFFIEEDYKYSLNQRICSLHSETNSNKFLFYRLNRHKYFLKFDTGYSQTNLRKDEVLNAPLIFPSLPEQQKIASFLSSIDEKLQQLTQKKELLAAYKKGVVQQLFSQELRFKDAKGKNYPDWEEKKLGEVLVEHKLKSTGKEAVFSVSVHKGLINQIEHLGRSFSAKNTDHYSLVKPNDLVYTKSPTGSFPLGIIKQAKIQTSVIVSPLYGVFTPESSSLGYMLDTYFESNINVHNYLQSIIQKGAKNTINITNTTFLSKALKLPIDKKEQKKIGDFLSALDVKIEKVITQINNTQAFKKGLLQQMFV